MKDLIKSLLKEALAMPTFDLPQNIKTNELLLSKIKNLTWKDISIDNTGDNGNDTLFFNIVFNDESIQSINEGIKFTIQLLFDTYYQPHMFLTESLQGKGLGPKILKSFIMDYGHLYAGNGRTVNDNANKILFSLKNDSDLEFISGEKGILIMRKNNPDRETLFKIVS
jgi:hypothetical protein